MTDPARSDDASARRVPSRGWYGLAFMLLLVGVSAFVASLNVARGQIAEMEANMHRFVAPGETTVTLDRAGPYHVYYEKVGRLGDEAFDTAGLYGGQLPKMYLTVKPAGGGELVSVLPASMDQAHIYGGGRANSEFVFEIDQPGAYQIEAKPQTPVEAPLLLAVGPPIADGLTSDWRGPFGGASILAFASVVSAVTVLVTYMLRHGHETRRRPDRAEPAPTP